MGGHREVCYVHDLRARRHREQRRHSVLAWEREALLQRTTVGVSAPAQSVRSPWKVTSTLRVRRCMRLGVRCFAQTPPTMDAGASRPHTLRLSLARSKYGYEASNDS